MRRFFGYCALTYLLIYAFEGVVRYGLAMAGASSVILLRDLLIILPLATLFVYQLSRGKVHPAYFVFALIVGVHGLVSAGNFHTLLPAIYGIDMLLPVLFGFIAAPELIQPSRKVILLLALVWIASIVGLVLDKFVLTFPWVGMATHVGGIKVNVSRGWDITQGPGKRVAGFTRSSIAAAMLLPTIALILAMRIRRYLPRMLFLLATVAATYLTTQKGSLAAIAVVTLLLATPAFMRYRLLCLAALGFTLLDIALPIFTSGLLVVDSGGVFSFASFNMRISDTWPNAWHWIFNNQIFPFGVGLGGIGGAQRFFAPNFFNPSDNLFIYLYANFGVFCLLYLGWVLWQAFRQPPEARVAAITPLAILVFNLGYGAALSMLEDQVSQLFFGASVGMLWVLYRSATARSWSDAFHGTPAQPQDALPYHQPARMGHSILEQP